MIMHYTLDTTPWWVYLYCFGPALLSLIVGMIAVFSGRAGKWQEWCFIAFFPLMGIGAILLSLARGVSGIELAIGIIAIVFFTPLVLFARTDTFSELFPNW